MTAVPLDHPEGGGYQVIVGVSLGASLLAPGARPGHNRYVLACCNTLGSGADARAWLAPGPTTGARLEACAPAAAVPATAIISASAAIDLIPLSLTLILASNFPRPATPYCGLVPQMIPLPPAVPRYTVPNVRMSPQITVVP